MAEQMEALVKELERSLEFYSSDDDTVKLVTVEIEKHHYFFGNPRVSKPHNRRISINGFRDYRSTNSCAGWIKEQLLLDGWSIDQRKGVAHNEKWFKKPK